MTRAATIVSAGSSLLPCCGRIGAFWLALLMLCAPVQAAPRILPLASNQWNEQQRAIAAEFETDAGVPNVVATLLHHPELAASVLPYQRYATSESTLPSRHRALLNLRTAWLTRSPYLWAQQAQAARTAGLTSEDFRRIAHGPLAPGWNTFEAALLAAADELHVDSFVQEATWDTLSARYNHDRLIDAVYGVGHLTLMAGVLNTLGVEVEAPVTERLPYGIPYTVAAQWTNERLIGKAARIPPLEPEEWTAEQRERFDPGGSGRHVANVFRTFVRNPPADRLRSAVSRHILNAATIPELDRELLLMRIGVLCRSEYEWAAHSRLGRRLGMSDADVERIIAGPTAGATPYETALLTAADELYRDDRVSEESWDVLAASLDTQQLLDVLIAVGGYRAASMAINTAGVQLDPNMAEFRFPPRLRR